MGFTRESPFGGTRRRGVDDFFFSLYRGVMRRGVGLLTLLVFTGTALWLSLNSPEPESRIQRTYLTAAGVSLVDFFEGRPIAPFKPGAGIGDREPTSECRPERNALHRALARLGRLLNMTATVHAQVEPWCEDPTGGWCAGAYWVDDWQDCYPWCRGRWNWGRSDWQNGDPCSGMQLAGYSPCEAFEIFASCNCTWRRCNSCFPP